MPLIDNATDAVLLTVVLLAAFGGGLAVKTHDPSLEADRRARATIRARGRHGLQPDTEQPDPDNTTIDEPDTIELPVVGDLTARQRYSNLHVVPAANPRARQHGPRQETGEIRLLSHMILTAAGWPDIYAAVHGEQHDDTILLFHETAAAVAEMPSPAAQRAAAIHQAAVKQLAVTP